MQNGLEINKFSEDRCEQRSVQMLQALFNKKDLTVKEIPHLFHWMNFPHVVDQSEISTDGHPKKGDFLPLFLFQDECGLVAV